MVYAFNISSCYISKEGRCFCIYQEEHYIRKLSPNIPGEILISYLFGTSSKIPVVAGRYHGLKTNPAAWAGTIMYVAVDVQVSRHWPVKLPVLRCSWYAGSEHAVKTFSSSTKPAIASRHLTRGFFCIHAHAEWFNVHLNNLHGWKLRRSTWICFFIHGNSLIQKILLNLILNIIYR